MLPILASVACNNPAPVPVSTARKAPPPKGNLQVVVEGMELKFADDLYAKLRAAGVEFGVVEGSLNPGAFSAYDSQVPVCLEICQEFEIEHHTKFVYAKAIKKHLKEGRQSEERGSSAKH
ncbi:MAG: hypothetical protein ABL949_02115 [Fimbriimonadaceae bacterium]